MTEHLPKDANIEQACTWLKAQTGETWILPRLLECHLTPHFWNDYQPGFPAIFGDRKEGYQTRMIFQGDLTRLEFDGAVALVTMFTTHDGSLIKVEPARRLPLNELRFKREAIERVARIVNESRQAAPVEVAPAQPAGTVPVPKVQAPASEPLPVTTGEIAFAFDGLHGWSEEQWKKPLGDKPKWLAACVAIPGVQGVSETRWNPVLIGAALERDGHAKANSIRARFQTKPRLMPWLDAWKTYEADYLPTE